MVDWMTPEIYRDGLPDKTKERKMSTFGEQLRSERESRGIALAAITDETKISSRYLRDLETENFDDLPGGVINKGIVRSYARVVGLDSEAWVDRFMSAYQSSGQLKDDDASWIAFAENVQKNRPLADRPAVRLKVTGLAVLVVILATLGWLVWNFMA